jgi:hypothetical protein
MLAAIVAAGTLIPSTVVQGVGGSCLPRALTAQEKQTGERIAAKLRPLLPPAPAGWKMDGADATDIASGSCLEDGKSVPQPVSVQVRRSFIRPDPPPAAPAANPPMPRPASAPDPQVRARVLALEQQIKDLKRQEAQITAAYQAARRAGDSPAQQAATARSREIRRAMDAPLKELKEIQDAERRQRTAENARRHEAAIAQTQTMLANRRTAHVSINTNSGRALARASKVVTIAGVPLAIAQPGFSTNLLFGTGWTHRGHEAYRPWIRGAPTSRVQDVNVRVDGNDEVMRALIGTLDVTALNAVIER